MKIYINCKINQAYIKVFNMHNFQWQECWSPSIVYKKNLKIGYKSIIKYKLVIYYNTQNNFVNTCNQYYKTQVKHD